MNEKSLKKAIDNYNKYRSPEATARLINIKENEIEVEFEGPFCQSCGVWDWFEDLKYELEDVGVKADISEAKQLDEFSYRVKFLISK